MQTLIEYRRERKQIEADLASCLTKSASSGVEKRGDKTKRGKEVARSQVPTLSARLDEASRSLSGLIAEQPPESSGESDDNDEDTRAKDHDNRVNVECKDDGVDRANPRNWTWTKRLRTTAILFLLVFAQGWVSACDSNVVLPASKEFHVSETSETLATGLFLIGLATGSLVAGPLSEQLGRSPVYIISSAFFLCFTLGSALSPNFGAQIIFRFLSGVFSGPTLSMYGGSLADMFTVDDRQKVWPVFALSPLLSPILAPVAAGWIAQHLYWRWVYWIGLIMSGSTFLLAFLFLPETFSPMIVQWRTHHLRQVSGKKRYTCELEGQASLMARLADNLIRPAKFFTTEPIIIALGAYLVVIYVVIFTFLNGFEFIFQDTYGLSPGLASLAFVGITIGALISTCLMPAFGMFHRRVLHKKNLAGLGPPELLLFPAMAASPFFAISIFWLGWTNFPSVSYWSGYAATVLFGYSMTAIFVSSYIYIIDSYGTWSSSALGSITLARYLVSGGMVIASRPMYEGIGVHWTLTFLGCLGAVLIPVPFLLYRYGDVIRKKSKFADSGDGDDDDDDRDDEKS